MVGANELRRKETGCPPGLAASRSKQRHPTWSLSPGWCWEPLGPSGSVWGLGVASRNSWGKSKVLEGRLSKWWPPQQGKTPPPKSAEKQWQKGLNPFDEELLSATVRVVMINANLQYTSFSQQPLIESSVIPWSGLTNTPRVWANGRRALIAWKTDGL